MGPSLRYGLLGWALAACPFAPAAGAFVPASASAGPWTRPLWAAPGGVEGGERADAESKAGGGKKKFAGGQKRGKKKEFTTLGALAQQLRSDKALMEEVQMKNRAKRKGTSAGGPKRRTRRRAERPQQRYVYASQRQREDGGGGGGEAKQGQEGGKAVASAAERRNSHLILAGEELGMRLTPPPPCLPQASSVHLPRIVGDLRVENGGDDDGSEGQGTGARAYVLYKPAGWDIRGGKPGAADRVRAGVRPGTSRGTKEEAAAASKERKGRDGRSSARGVDDDGMAFDLGASDLASVMTAEELAELNGEGGLVSMGVLVPGGQEGTTTAEEAETRMAPPRLNGAGAVAATTKEQEPAADGSSSPAPGDDVASSRPDMLRQVGNPSLVAWLKACMADRGTPIRGGKFWRAVAGAVDIDDSGLVVLCPKDKTANLHVDYATYVAVVGNGMKTAPRGKAARERPSTYDRDGVTIDVVSRLRTGRRDDPVQTAAVTFPDGFSSSADAVREVQAQFDDGIRGDAAADPLDRRASRRLVHCGALLVSSLVHDDDVEAIEDPTDDIALLSERGEWGADFVRGSFLGRIELRNDDLTTAYREINGAADGYPGWIVDRYGEWLLVQHDTAAGAAGGVGERGPLPSIHDGNTKGIYYFATDPDRSTISEAKPVLLEGEPAPDTIPVKENGITYHAKLGDSFSTGIFLDQRPQRAWLARHCNSDTRVLNCFAHCGAFSVAAAVAGASTVSLDLDKKWLDRIEPQMAANGISDFSERHDAIYGDCFDWLARLAKRGEKYDIVILDPPSTSVGKKKKRWSVSRDMAELVALAAPLVKSGGLLWTTTNSASLRVDKFAKLCKKGLDSVDLGDARLERTASVPLDFPSIGPHGIKNLVWRMP